MKKIVFFLPALLLLLAGMLAIVALAGPSWREEPQPMWQREAPLVQARGEQLPFAGGQFDMVSMGYALRHVPDLLRLFNEYRRVLTPGGRVVILEVAQPESTIGRRLNKMFLQTIVPRIAQISTGRADAKRMMDYFWDTIEQCVPPDVILSALTRAGFEATRTVTGGVLGQYLGTVKAGA